MKKAYWIAPTLVLVLFIVLYMNSRHEIEAAHQERLAADAKARQEKKEKAERDAKLAAERRAEEVRLANDKRKQEEEREKAEKELFEKLNYQRNFANGEAERLKKVVDDLKKDIDSEVEARKKADETIAKLKEEKTFLASYGTKADANAKNLQALLTKIEEVDRQVIAAREAAKAAAEKKS